MFLLLVHVLIFFFFFGLSSSISDSFILNGFSDDVTTEGSATIATDGLLILTNISRKTIGHAFYTSPLRLGDGKKSKNHHTSIFSFSTSFVFAIVPEYPQAASMGMAFVMTPRKHLPLDIQAEPYLGVFDSITNGSSTNHIVAVEFSDIMNSRVAIHVNGQVPLNARKAAYYDPKTSKFTNLSIFTGERMQVWIDYDSREMDFHVAIAPVPTDMDRIAIPSRPFLSTKINLTDAIFNKDMYVGFSASAGMAATAHYILGWSFETNSTTAPPLRLSNLPKLPKPINPNNSNRLTLLLPIAVPLIAALLLLLFAALVVLGVRRTRKYAEELEDWEKEYGPHRFCYKDLYRATGGFKDEKLLGAGGFGKVYRGVLPKSKDEIAVKKISHDSKQGMREFVAEIASMGRLRHRNLVQLLGYCRRKGELLLVYEFMPNGSLDKLLFEQDADKYVYGDSGDSSSSLWASSKAGVLNWSKRFRIIKGVASGLLYLHQGWDQLVVHRDVKASNVLLDAELNARLGDFGLARLYDHGTNPQTTHLVGTVGYMAPEFIRQGKATTATDVFAFGVFLLEIACGRRPIEHKKSKTSDEIITFDWVLKNWSKQALLSSMDENIVGGEYATEEVNLVLKLGLLCCHSMENARPNMKQVVQLLDGDILLPDLTPDYWVNNTVSLKRNDSFDDYLRSRALQSDPCSNVATGYSSDLFISDGR